MNDKTMDFCSLYQAALLRQLEQGPGADLAPACELGQLAITAGLETLDLAHVHELALASILLPTSSASTNNRLIGLAGLFFAEALTPIEQTHRGAREADTHLNQIVKALSQRTIELASSVEEMKEEIRQREVIEESLRASELDTVQHLEQSRGLQEELRYLSHQLLSALEDERKRISQELHEVIGETLSSIHVSLTRLKAESVTNTKQLQNQIASTQRLIEKSVEIVHRFASELRPAMLDDLGLIPALHSFLDDFINSTGIQTSLKVFSGIEEASGAVHTMLFRVAKEALSNVARHAKATHAEVNIVALNGVIQMTITDDGQGFQMSGLQELGPHNRLGLLGMRERVEMLGGTFSVESAPGHPTTVRVELPQLAAETQLATSQYQSSPPSTS
jgi:signal transduction histidine kinase